MMIPRTAGRPNLVGRTAPSGRPWLLWAATAVGALGWVLGTAAWADPPRGPTLEKQLLDHLRAGSLDKDIARELFGREHQQATPGNRPLGRPDYPGVEPDDLTEPLLGELGPAAGGEDENPLVDVARKMRSVEGRIDQADSGQDTQAMQQDIVAQLESLLEQARSCCSQAEAPPSPKQQQVASRRPVSQPEQQNKPTQGGEKPAATAPRDPQTTAGSSAARRPDMQEMRALMKRVWGELPPGEREQMLELPAEEFLPKYERLIEAYFKRLAEEHPEVDRWPANDSQAP